MVAGAYTRTENIGVVLLAAGTSSRLGTPKQLLRYNSQTLLKHSLQMATSSNAHPVVVVLGAFAETIAKETSIGAVHVVVNADWPEGMASSIRTGVKALLETDPDVEALILMVCDQPFVTDSL